MADKQTGIKLKVSAVDETARVFKRVASSALGVAGAIAKWTAAAGIGGVAAFTTAVAVASKKLSTLSDVAQAAGTTTEEITKLSTALGILGVKGSAPEELSLAFQRMTKATGAVGMEGFHKIVEEIAKLPTITERSAAAMQVFGRSGTQFMPIIEAAAKNGILALKDLEAGIPGISQSAADAGDAFADSMDVMKAGAAKVWNEGLMKVASNIAGVFTEDVRTASLICAAQMEYLGRVAWEYMKPFFSNSAKAFDDFGKLMVKWADNIMVIIGGVLVASAKNIWDKANEIAFEITGFIDYSINKFILNDEKAAMAAIDTVLRNEKEATAKARKDWADVFGTFRRLDWGADGTMFDLDLSALKKQRDEAVETAKRAGAAYSAAAIKVSASDRAKLETENAKTQRARDRQPELILGGTYKAITYAMRHGYASGIEEVKSLIKKVVDGVNNVEKAIEDNGNNLAVVGG